MSGCRDKFSYSNIVGPSRLGLRKRWKSKQGEAHYEICSRFHIFIFRSWLCLGGQQPEIRFAVAAPRGHPRPPTQASYKQPLLGGPTSESHQIRVETRSEPVEVSNWLAAIHGGKACLAEGIRMDHKTDQCSTRIIGDIDFFNLEGMNRKDVMVRFIALRRACAAKRMGTII
jgi:hypothetical protein